MFDEISNAVLIADMNVICELSNYYYKQSLIEENSDVYMEGFSLKEAGKKLWRMFIHALKTLQRWFHKKTKFVFMKKRMENATPKEMEKFKKSLDMIDECLGAIDKAFTSIDAFSDVKDKMGTFSNMQLSMQNYADQLENVFKNYYVMFGGEE